MEQIRIKNFAGIDNLEIRLNRINVFIGRQASGKSVTAKLIYFFKGVSRELLEGAQAEITRSKVEKRLLTKFEEYFPSETWPSKNFEIVYYFDDNYIQVKKEQNKLSIYFSEVLGKLFNNCKRIIKADKDKFKPEDKFEVYRPSYQIHEKFFSIVEKELGANASYNPLFIPAGRSFFANLQSSIFSFLSNNKAIDPFLVEFGSFYENIKPVASRNLGYRDERQKQVLSLADNLIYEIIGGKYDRDKNKDYLLHADKRKINVSFSSSGQQETLPLLLILKALLKVNFVGSGSSVFIEEPEAHLFPSAQKKVVELMGLIFNASRTPAQLIVTTHSPYVLTSLNNLIQGFLMAQSEDSMESVYSIIPKDVLLNDAFISAYAFRDGTAESIMDIDTKLIHSRYLDSVSEEIAIEFDKLLDLM